MKWFVRDLLFNLRCILPFTKPDPLELYQISERRIDVTIGVSRYETARYGKSKTFIEKASNSMKNIALEIPALESIECRKLRR